MDTIKALKTRRSVRRFTDEKIPEDLLIDCIECGMYAPSAGNEQPWHFILITDPQILKKIPSIHQYAQMMNDAAAGIVVCFDPTLEKHNPMSVQDCAAATQNILLAVHAMGYGSCWLGVYPREKRMQGFRDLFKIPDHVVPFSAIAVGKPVKEKTEVDRYKSDRLHRESW